MPMIACSSCKNYVSAPDVESNTPFLCPYCKKPNCILYKCFSCTKVSIFDSTAMPRICPKCFTMVRSSRPLQVPFIETDWLYHITPTVVARIIRTNGLCSAFIRTGRREPDPHGSFALDRVNRIEKKYREFLRKYVTLCRNHKDPPVLNDDGSLARPNIVCRKTASNDDYNVLEKIEKQLFETFAKKNMPKYSKNLKNFTKVSKENETTQLVESLILQPDHYLTILAKQVASHDFDVEGAITSSNVYFLNTEDQKSMLDGFSDYTKLRTRGTYVVLRAPRSRVTGLEDDMADSRALRTPEIVPGDVFQVMIGTDEPRIDFPNINFRSRRENWMSLSDWQ